MDMAGFDLADCAAMRSALLPSGLRPSDAACLRQLAAQLLLHDHEPRSPNSHVERRASIVK